MNRRNFIKYSSIAGGATLLIGGGIWFSSFHDKVAQVIKEDTSSLMVDEADIMKFISDGEKNNYWGQFSGMKELSLKAGSMTEWFIPGSMRAKIEQTRAKITGQFLLSTDFFANGMNELKPVTYIGFYDPYSTPCSNPFAG